MHQGSVLSALLYAIVVDVVTGSARKSILNEILYADDLVLTAETMEDQSENLQKWNAVFESKGMKVNIGKMMVIQWVGQKEKYSQVR